MIIIAGTITADPAKIAEFQPAFTKMMEASRAEDGCVAYVIAVDPLDAGTLNVFEQWASDEVLGSHMVSPHMAEFGQTIGGLGATSVDLKKYSGATEGPLF